LLQVQLEKTVEPAGELALAGQAVMLPLAQYEPAVHETQALAPWEAAYCAAGHGMGLALLAGQ
jgi:hypothetical protein